MDKNSNTVDRYFQGEVKSAVEALRVVGVHNPEFKGHKRLDVQVPSEG